MPALRWLNEIGIQFCEPVERTPYLRIKMKSDDKLLRTFYFNALNAIAIFQVRE